MTRRELFQQSLKEGDWISGYCKVDAVILYYYEIFDDEVRYTKTHNKGDYKNSIVVYRQFCYEDGRLKRNTPKYVRLSYIWPPTKKELKVVEKAIAQHPDKYSLWLKHKIMPKGYQHFAYHIKQGTVEEVKEKIITLIEQLPERFTFSEWIGKGNNMDLGIDLLDFMPCGYFPNQPSISL